MMLMRLMLFMRLPLIDRCRYLCKNRSTFISGTESKLKKLKVIHHFHHFHHFYHFHKFVLPFLFCFPLTVQASFIEATLGTAVVNDATASYYNPAALTLLKTPQIIFLGSEGRVYSRFTGQIIQTASGFTQNGSAGSNSNFNLPSFYLGMPIANKFTIGLAVVANYFNKDIGEGSLLRYVQASNDVQDVDLVPALGFKLNDWVSLGAGINISRAKFVFEPIIGFPSLNIPDSQSRNEASATGKGWDAGILLKPSRSTLMGFNYRSAITYPFSGSSIYNGNSQVVSNYYSFHYWTPGRAVFSINQRLTSSLGAVATVQRIQWSLYNTVHAYGIAGPFGIVNANIPYHLHDAWLITLGGQYRLMPNWVVRVAGSYNQSPGNSHYQISNGDSLIVGASMGYDLNQYITIDGSYAYVFMQNQNINIVSPNTIIRGVNEGLSNSYSLKLTLNV
jgi:long-chain fatty acid transport protein